jgi:hypothetical protein
LAYTLSEGDEAFSLSIEIINHLITALPNQKIFIWEARIVHGIFFIIARNYKQMEQIEKHPDEGTGAKRITRKLSK